MRTRIAGTSISMVAKCVVAKSLALSGKVYNVCWITTSGFDCPPSFLSKMAAFGKRAFFITDTPKLLSVGGTRA